MCHKISEKAPKYYENILLNLLTCRHFSLALCSSKMTTKSKISRRHISGVFLLNKPLGLSSNAAFAKSALALPCPKAGHTGALDPLATGLLPICLGGH